MKAADRILGVAFIVLSAAMSMGARGFEPRAPFAAHYVYFLSTVMIILSAALLLASILRPDERPYPKPAKVPQLVAFLAGTVLYLLGIRYIGFYVSSFAFMIIIMRVLGMKDLRVLLIVPVVVLVCLHAVIMFLQVPLPEGLLF